MIWLHLYVEHVMRAQLPQDTIIFMIKKTNITGIPRKTAALYIQMASDNFFVLIIWNNDLSNMAELPSFSPPASESTLQHRTSPLRQARMRPKLKAAPVYI